MGAQFGHGAGGNRSMLLRARLLAQLESRWDVRVTVIYAPAGFGKTTLLSQSLAANSDDAIGRDCFVTCGRDFAAASALGHALCEALEVPTVPAQGRLDDFARTVIDAVWQRSPGQVALIVDDAHEIPAGSEGAALLERIAGSLSDNGHLVLAGRRAPSRFPKLEVQGRVAHVDEDDLRFTDDELADFASMREVPIAQLQGSDGWPARAELLASAPPGTTDEYMGRDALSHLSSDQRRVFALLAHVGSVDDEIVHAVTRARMDPADYVAGIPAVVMTAERSWSIHSLWQEWLAGEVTASEVAEARRQAGFVRLQRNETAEAVQLLIDAQAWEDVGQAIAIALSAAHPPVARDVLEQWLARLPATMREMPAGQLLEAVLAVETDPERAWQLFDRCAQAFRDARQTSGELACLVQLGELAWWSERLDRLAPVAARSFELEASGNRDAVPFACLGRALIADIHCDSEQVLRELECIPPGSVNETWQGIVSWAKSIALLQLGYASEAQCEAERALTYRGSLHAPLAETTRLQAMWHQGAVSEVVAALPEFVDQITASGYKTQAVMVHAHCSMVHAMQGNAAQAGDHLNQASAAATAIVSAPLVDAIMVVAKATLAIATDDEATAFSALTSYLERFPVNQGLPAAAHRRHLAVLYTMVPATRPVWDSAELGPAFQPGLALAHAMTAVREERRLPTHAAPLEHRSVIQAHLPMRWIADLALAAIAEGIADGWDLLDETWNVTHKRVLEVHGDKRDPLSESAEQVLARFAVPPKARLELRILGPIELLRDGKPIAAETWRRSRVRTLLAHLALRKSARRAQVAADIWSDKSHETRLRNLRVTLNYLLKALEPDRRKEAPSFFIREDEDKLALLTGEWLRVDIVEFDRHCRLAEHAGRRGSPQAELDHALQAVELWRGEPIEVMDHDDARFEIYERRERFAKMATRAGELLLGKREGERARTLAGRALDADPFLDQAHRLVIASHIAERNHLAARQARDRYREQAGCRSDEIDAMVQRLLDKLPSGAS